MLGTNNVDGINDGFVLGTIGFVSRTNDSRVTVLDLAGGVADCGVPGTTERGGDIGVLRAEVACLDQQQ